MTNQLQLFPETEHQKLRRELQELRDHVSSLRKSWFAKISEERRRSDAMYHEIETLKSALCRAKRNHFANYPLFAEIK